MNLAAISHYEITDHIGGGGIGFVYKANDTMSGQQVALKHLSTPDLPIATTLDALERFRLQASALSALKHRNIRAVREVGFENGSAFIAMDWLMGQTFRDFLGGNSIPSYKLPAFATQLADALHAAHSIGIIHGDIKPNNVFVVSDGTPKFLDFGMTVLSNRWRTGEMPPTRWFSLNYMAPEWFTANSPVDVSSDLYSLGVLFYEMATAQEPFRGPDLKSIIGGIIFGTYAPPRELNPAVSEGFERIIMRSLEKNRKLRYQAAADLLRDLEALAR